VETGVLQPGEVLKDVEIASRLGVSRTPVREALQMLEQLGIVQILPGSKTRIAPTAPEDLSQVYEPLAALQALAAALGTRFATNDHVRELHLANEKMLAAVLLSDPISARNADDEFHRVLVRLSGNKYLEQAIEPLLLHVRRLENTYFAERGPALESYRQHEQIITAVAANDAIAASDFTRENFLRYRLPQ
jgi:DNA-binding GntR family transcriptional regulator